MKRFLLAPFLIFFGAGFVILSLLAGAFCIITAILVKAGE